MKEAPVQKITTPGGEVLVLMPLADYEALLDAADIASADRVKADIAAGRDELVPAEVVDRLLDGENPVTVWREHRGLTGRELARRAEVSAPYLSQIESGAKPGSTAALAKLARALGIQIDDLIA
jgi:DNA-binding XRE family transcriptional regulator